MFVYIYIYIYIYFYINLLSPNNVLLIFLIIWKFGLKEIY